jgi:hypothetical protein
MNAHKKMLMVSRTLVCLLSAYVLLFETGGSARADRIWHGNTIPTEIEKKANRLMHDLTKKGFEVSRGYFKLWTVDDCEYTEKKVGVCYGNNPAAPYVVSTVLPWPEEYWEEDTDDPYYGRSNIWGVSDEGYIDVYRFDSREAIIIFGKLPPQAAFFSEQTWAFTRQGDFNKDSATYWNVYNDFSDFFNLFFIKVPGHDERVQIFSALSNPINNVVIERQSEKAFDQIRYFIVTPDRFMDKAVRKALAGLSVNEEDVFTEPIPSDMNLGLDQSSDDFTTWFRYVHPDNEGAADKWREDLPLVLLRVRDTRSHRKPKTYPPVVLETRVAENELKYKENLLDLIAVVKDEWKQAGYEIDDCSGLSESFTDLQRAPVNMVGPECMQTGENCLGDNWDASYQLFGPMTLDNREAYAVAGTLGTETGNATYVGVGINQVPMMKGVANLFDKVLRNTANKYKNDVENTDKFFLYYFTWNCSDLGFNDDDDDPCLSLYKYLPVDKPEFAISIRNYIKPGTQRGPDSAFVLPSRVLKMQIP